MRKHYIFLVVFLAMAVDGIALEINDSQMKWGDEKGTGTVSQGVGKDKSDSSFYFLANEGSYFRHLNKNYLNICDYSTIVFGENGWKSTIRHPSGIFFEKMNDEKNVWSIESNYDGMELVANYQYAYRMGFSSGTLLSSSANPLKVGLNPDSAIYSSFLDIKQKKIVTDKSADSYDESELSGFTIVRNRFGPDLLFSVNFTLPGIPLFNDLTVVPSLYIKELNNSSNAKRLPLPVEWKAMQGLAYSYNYNLFFVSDGIDNIWSEKNKIHVFRVTSSNGDYSIKTFPDLEFKFNIGESWTKRAEVEGLSFDDGRDELYINLKMADAIGPIPNPATVQNRLYVVKLSGYRDFSKYYIPGIVPLINTLMEK